jgi:L-lactate dehydrogenase (cytochrome)
LARRRLPDPIFNYVDGGADDEATLRRNTASFERCDLVTNILRGVGELDLSVSVMAQKLAMPVYCSPTATRLFHHDGERAVAAAAAQYGTMFGVSSLGTVSLEELRKKYKTPQVYQFYFHKDRGLNQAMVHLRTGFSIPFRLTLGGNAAICDQADLGNKLCHPRKIQIAAMIVAPAAQISRCG